MILALILPCVTKTCPLTRPVTTESVFYFFVSAAIHAESHEDAPDDIISSHIIEQHLKATLRGLEAEAEESREESTFSHLNPAFVVKISVLP